MSFAPFVIVTATTEIIRGRSRVSLNEPYTDALASVGLVPLILPPSDPSIAAGSLREIAGLVLTGGEDIDPRRFGEEPVPEAGEPHHPRDAYEIALARAAYERRIPTFAICRGIQIMNVALGGTLVQDIPTQLRTTINHVQAEQRHDRVHDVRFDGDSRIADVLGATEIRVNSSHHQSVGDVSRELKVTGRSPDGVIEAVEPVDPAWWMIGVQWHPEELTGTPEDWDRRLFSAFASEVRAVGRD
jgi:putative glutamine amidotransferase